MSVFWKPDSVRLRRSRATVTEGRRTCNRWLDCTESADGASAETCGLKESHGLLVALLDLLIDRCVRTSFKVQQAGGNEKIGFGERPPILNTL